LFSVILCVCWKFIHNFTFPCLFARNSSSIPPSVRSILAACSEVYSRNLEMLSFHPELSSGPMAAWSSKSFLEDNQHSWLNFVRTSVLDYLYWEALQWNYNTPSEPMARLSGLQREVLSLYRKCLREIRKKPSVSLLLKAHFIWLSD
jgi:hypothetical protein